MLMEFFKCAQGNCCLSYDPIPVEVPSTRSDVGTCRGYVPRGANMQHLTRASALQAHSRDRAATNRL